MASTRAVPGDGSDGDGVDLLGSAAALRWSRPDLAAAIADHVLEISEPDADPARWLRAAGWAVSARSATGDGRTIASEVLDGVVRRGAHILDEPAADRLRVELALLATAAGRLSTARTLLTPVSVAETGAELRADALGALARCAVEDRPAAVDGLLHRVESTWAEVGGPRGRIGTAAASLVAATAERRAGRPGVAVEKAAEGLARLESARGGRAQSPSRHLAAGLAAEWISGLLDAGRADEARDGCVPLEGRLRDTSRPSRQMALLRLAVARTVTGSGADAVVAALTQAARDAAASDVPDLESVCLSTLAALQEKSGQLEQGLESGRLGGAAQRRDRQRAERFRNALDAAVSAGAPEEAPLQTATNGGRARVTGHHRPEASASSTSPGGSWTDWGSAVARDRTSSDTSNGSAHRAGDTGRTQSPANARNSNGLGSGRSGSSSNGATSNGDGGLTRDLTATDPHGMSPWQGWTDDSPIGHLLAQSLRSGGTSGSTSGSTAKGTVTPPPAEPTPPAGGRASRREERRYPEAVADPWSTGSWSTGHWAQKEGAQKEGAQKEGAQKDEARKNEAQTDGTATPDAAATSGRAGRRRRAEPLDELAGAAPLEPSTASPEPSVLDGPSRWYARYEQSTAERAAADRAEAEADLAVEPGSGSWLQNALAELDRAWGAAPTAAPTAGSPPAPAPPAATSPGPNQRRPEPGPEADGCVVVIDLARDGRRFAGRRAGSVVRAIADRLGDRLPSGARVRHDDADALSVVLPGWSRSPATEWMHRTLPGLFEEFVPDEDMPGTQLRAAVHDTDGPVGAQLLQRLDRPQRRHATRDALSTGPLWGSLPPEPVAAPVPPTGGGRRHRRSPEEPSEQPVATSQDVLESAPRPVDRGAQSDSTDGLGLADLLAGALAAYRGI